MSSQVKRHVWPGGDAAAGSPMGSWRAHKPRWEQKDLNNLKEDLSLKSTKSSAC
jgi:hypothetical protein